MKHIHEHYAKERLKYADLAEEGAESFIAYYRETFPENYEALYGAELKMAKLRQYDDKELFVVQSGWNGDSRLWWRLKNRGYTVDLNSAQTYTKKEMIDWLQRDFRDTDRIWSHTHVMDSAIKVSHSQFTNPKFSI